MYLWPVEEHIIVANSGGKPPLWAGSLCYTSGVNGRLDRRDWVFWGATFGAALLAAVLFYTAAFNRPPADYSFSGFPVNSHDCWAYRALANYYSGEGCLVDNPYAAFRRPPIYFNLVWFTIGKLMRYTGLPFLVIYFAFGVLAGGAMYLLLLALMRALSEERMTAWIAYLLAGFGSGLSWMVFLFWPNALNGRFRAGYFPYLESFPVNAFLFLPHVSFAFALLIAVYLCFHRAATGGGRRWAVAGGAVLLVMGFSHPYHYLTVAAVLGCWYVVMNVRQGREWLGRWGDLAIAALCMLPAAAYFLLVVFRSQNFYHWQLQKVLLPGWPHMLISMGPLLLFAPLGLRGLWPPRQASSGLLLTVTWALVNPLLLMTRGLIPFEARLVLGLALPLALLAAKGISWGVRFAGGIAAGAMGAPRRRIAAGAVIAAILLAGMLPNQWLVVGEQLTIIGRLGADGYPNTGSNPRLLIGDFSSTINTKITLHRDELEALRFLGDNYRDYPLVLSTREIGLVFPAFARVRSYIGHFVFTYPFNYKMAFYWRFFAEPDDDRRLALLKREARDVSLVWWGPIETLQARFNPDETPWLSKVFENGLVRIYRVVKPVP